MLKKIPVIILYMLCSTTIMLQAEVKTSKTKKVVIDERKVVRAMKMGLKEVKELLKNVSIYQLFPENKTLLHYAVESGNYKIVSYLVNKNSPLAQKGGRFYGTPLHSAIYYGHTRMALFLINKRTPLNIQDVRGDTPLHLAAERGNLTLIRTLVQHGASIHIMNNDRKVPYNLIPKLTWENEKEMQRLLYNKKSKQDKSTEIPRSRGLFIQQHMTPSSLKKSRNSIRNKIDKRSHFNNSQVGININLKKKKDPL